MFDLHTVVQLQTTSGLSHYLREWMLLRGGILLQSVLPYREVLEKEQETLLSKVLETVGLNDIYTYRTRQALKIGFPSLYGHYIRKD